MEHPFLAFVKEYITGGNYFPPICFTCGHILPLKMVCYYGCLIVCCNQEANDMSETYTEITIMNAVDVDNAENGRINQTDVRQTTVQALVDTGSTDLVINEAIRRKLGLRIASEGFVELADGTQVPHLETGPVELYWKDRRTSCCAVIFPDQTDQRSVEVLLGVFPMESLDLTVNPYLQKVTGAHGNMKRHVFRYSR